MSRLSREQWASAALDALSGGGLAAVAVEPLATRLGTTKGSFYWHFGGREELVQAALQLWRQASTTSIIERLESGDAPAAERLRQLFTQVFAPQARTDADLALLADADHPLVASALADVTEQRLGYITALFRELGFPPARARRRALLAYSAYLGQLQLLRTAPDLLPKPGPARTAYADDILAALLTDQPAKRA
ncbi:TetR/AcrR family transcriptional regulator [Actinoplanes sp. NPDC049668]|uniref:TetR/AcrR family transcriptional regulator n=1 Tax=unclassified Actinoplanes TaxID=2626549 RepID=UPI0033B0B21B